MQDLEIRKVTSDDIYQLQTIGRQTFFETFSEGNTEENMAKYLEESFTFEKLYEELQDINSETYFAIHENEIIGYLKLNVGKSQTELIEDNAIEIERIYVLHKFHGKNVGQKLYEKAVQIANWKNCNYLWSGVWEENSRAIHFYTKNGFIKFDQHIFKLGNDEQTDRMMKLNLKD